MTPEAIKALRQELKCTARELATALGLEQETVLAWERGDLFPTKKYVSQMDALREKGPTAIARKPKKAANRSPMQGLADPELWKILRKLLHHAELRAQVETLAAPYADPLEES